MAFFKIKIRKKLILKFEGDNWAEYASCSSEKDCVGGIFQIANNGFTNIQYDCCNTNLCNSKDLIKKKLDFNCEFNKQIDSKYKLIYAAKIPPKTSVKTCYSCDSCTSSYKSAQIVICADRFKLNEKFACHVRFFINQF